MNKPQFVPKILLCGEESALSAQVGNRPYKIVGKVKFFGEVDGQMLNFPQDGKCYLDGKIQTTDDLGKTIQGGTFDYLIFTGFDEYRIVTALLRQKNILSPKLITTDQFAASPTEFFCDVNADILLMIHLKNIAVKTLLDVDGYFAKGHLFTKMHNDLTEIDCIAAEPLPPVADNIYTHTYKSLAEVGFKRYDAALIAERAPIEFDSLFVMLEDYTDTIITYARNGSELERHILTSVRNFSKGDGLRTAAGNWFFLRRHTTPENFCVYVVTHKPAPHDGKLPEGYKMIHAGRALNPDLGYLGDNTGDNISHLNLYINELTALYWVWKNTNHTVIGLAHYRRFFTESVNPAFAYDKILTRDAANKLLERYDILVGTIYYGMMTQHEFVQNDCGTELPTFAEGIIKKHLLKAQPDYVEAFEQVMRSLTLFKCNMFVTRRNVVDAFCKWLFSFLIDATEEVLHSVSLEKFSWTPRRLMSFLAERMLTVWLIKNRLRVKELEIMQVPGL